MWSIKLSSKSSFCRAVVAAGFLSQRQMVRAALRYRLGCSRDDAVIYWQVNKCFPLRHHKVILFPDTDPDGMAFTRWYDAAQEVMKSFFWPNDNPIRVSPLLERHATPDQKRRKIDLVDFLFEKRHYPPPIVP